VRSGRARHESKRRLMQIFTTARVEADGPQLRGIHQKANVSSLKTSLASCLSGRSISLFQIRDVFLKLCRPCSNMHAHLGKAAATRKANGMGSHGRRLFTHILNAGSLFALQHVLSQKCTNHWVFKRSMKKHQAMHLQARRFEVANDTTFRKADDQRKTRLGPSFWTQLRSNDWGFSKPGCSSMKGERGVYLAEDGPGLLLLHDHLAQLQKVGRHSGELPVERPPSSKVGGRLEHLQLPQKRRHSRDSHRLDLGPVQQNHRVAVAHPIDLHRKSRLYIEIAHRFGLLLINP
jgi:hypothetical protein